MVTQDYDGDGLLSFSEFSELINAFGNQHAANKVCIIDLHIIVYASWTEKWDLIIRY